MEEGQNNKKINSEIQVKGEYTVLDGGKIKIKGLSSIQFDVIMALLRSWKYNK